MVMKRLYYIFASTLAAAVSLSSCKTEIKTVEVTEVKVSPSTGSVVAGQTITLTAEVLPKNASDKTVTWLSRDESKATVDKNGTVTGIKAGEVQIAAISANKKSGFATITVTPAPIRVKTVTLDHNEISIFVGKFQILKASIDPENATYPEVTWTTSNDQIAKVENGKVTGVSAGEATITATADEKSAVCKVTVSLPAISNLVLPYISDISGNEVVFTGEGIMAGDKFKLTAVAGEAYSQEVNLTATETGGKFTLPAGINRNRSYRIDALRNGEIKAKAWLHPDNVFCTMPYALGYFMTGHNEVVPDEDENTPDHLKVTWRSTVRRGYIEGNIVDYNEATREFRVWKADADLSTVKCGETFDIVQCSVVYDLSPMKGIIDFSAVKTVKANDSDLKGLDMTMFPNAEYLYAWGDPGSQLNKIASFKINSGNKLKHIQLERQSLAGELNLSDLMNVQCSVVLDDNKIESINLNRLDGKANLIYALSAKNNKLREIDIQNCGQIRKLQLKGNKIERATLLMQKTESEGFPGYLYLFKAKDAFNADWATAAEAQGRERWIKVEYYWWRCLSNSNTDENTAQGFKEPYDEEGWEVNGPVVQALNSGFKVDCWHSSSWYAPFSFLHSHAGGTNPCPRQ